MTKVQIIGRKRQRAAVLERLHRLRLVQLVDVAQESALELAPLSGDDQRGARVDDLRLLAAQLESLLDLLEPAAGPAPLYEEDPIAGEIDAEPVQEQLRTLAPRVEALTERLEAFRVEQIVLRRYVEPLLRLLPLVPELAELSERELASLGLDVVALVLNTDDDRVVETLRQELEATLGRRFDLLATRVDAHAIGCVLAFAHDATDKVHALLSHERVRHLPLPEAYESLSLVGAVDAMERRLSDIPAELAAARAALDDLIRPHEEDWRTLHAALHAKLEQLEAISLLGGTRRAFVVVCWVPRPQLARLRQELEHDIDAELVVEELSVGRRDTSAPVLMYNPAPARPFEFLVRFLDLPRTGSFDPTCLMALFLPLMFGVMVGDVVYGALLLAVALFVRRRFAPRSPVVRDLSRVLMAGAAWAVVFGLLFGEALGSLGKKLGMPALWFYRGGLDAVEPLLLFAVAIGAAHVVLGVLLGLWQSWQMRQPRQALDKIGTLLVLSAVFAVAGVAADMLPAAAATPAAAAAVTGVVLVMAPHGALGLFLGPLELLGTLGNILSYLRLAAVGLASAYLAVVANELALVGPLWMGVLVAAFFHCLNLALAAFTPLIQSLRLHYVEFFSKFYVGGGQPFRRFGERAGGWGRASRRTTPAGRPVALAVNP